MNYNDYRHEVYEDTIQYIKDCEYLNNFADPDPDYQWNEREFYDMMDEAELSVTGNDNGSYYFNFPKAQEAVKDIIFNDDFYDAAQCHETWYYFQKYLGKQDAEAADVIARLTAFRENWCDIQKWLEEQIGRELD